MALIRVNVTSFCIFAAILILLRVFCGFYWPLRSALRRIKGLGADRRFRNYEIKKQLIKCLGHLYRRDIICRRHYKSLKREYKRYHTDTWVKSGCHFTYPFRNLGNMVKELSHLVRLSRKVERLPDPVGMSAGNNRIALEFMLESQLDYEIFAVMFEIMLKVSV